MNRKVKKQIWMTEREAENLRSKAAGAGRTEAAFIRELVDGYCPPTLPGSEFYEAMDIIRGMGDKINILLAKPGLTEEDVRLLEFEAKKWHIVENEFEKKYLRPERREV